MKKATEINEMATELIKTVAKGENKNNAMIILSVIDEENGENTGNIIAACGTTTRMATIISVAMMKNEHLKEAVMMAAGLNEILDSDSPSPIPGGLAALLAGVLGK